MLTSFILTLSFGFVCFTPSASNEIADKYDADAVMHEAPTAWAEYKKISRSLQCKVDNQLTVNGELRFHCTSEYKQNPRCRLMLRNYLLGGPKKPTDRVDAFNDQYSFSLSRLAGRQDWRLVELLPDWKAVAKDLNDPHSTMQETDILIRVNFIELATLFKRDDFRIEKTEQLLLKDLEYVAVEFSCVHDHQSQPFFPIQRGRVVLIPGLYWCLAEASLACKYKGANPDCDITINNEFQVSTAKNVPLPIKHSMMSVLRGSAEKKVSRVLRYSGLEEGEPADEEFRLTAFGVPEPVGLKYDRPFPWYLWGLIVGGALLLAAVVFRRYIFRQA